MERGSNLCAKNYQSRVLVFGLVVKDNTLRVGDHGFETQMGPGSLIFDEIRNKWLWISRSKVGGFPFRTPAGVKKFNPIELFFSHWITIQITCWSGFE
jgi:hypothetical protein